MQKWGRGARRTGKCCRYPAGPAQIFYTAARAAHSLGRRDALVGHHLPYSAPINNNIAGTRGTQIWTRVLFHKTGPQIRRKRCTNLTKLWLQTGKIASILINRLFPPDAHHGPEIRRGYPGTPFAIAGNCALTFLQKELATFLEREQATVRPVPLPCCFPPMTQVPLQAKVQSSVHQLTGICWKKCVVQPCFLQPR